MTGAIHNATAAHSWTASTPPAKEEKPAEQQLPVDMADLGALSEAFKNVTPEQLDEAFKFLDTPEGQKAFDDMAAAMGVDEMIAQIPEDKRKEMQAEAEEILRQMSEPGFWNIAGEN